MAGAGPRGYCIGTDCISTGFLFCLGYADYSKLEGRISDKECFELFGALEMF